MDQEWLTTKEAAKILNTSVRNVNTKIHSGKLRAKRDGKIWLVHGSLSPPTQEESGGQKETIENLKETVTYLKSEMERKNQQIERLQEQLVTADERHDTIVLQLTRQLEQSQRLLEYHESSWWRRWRRRRRDREEEEKSRTR